MHIRSYTAVKLQVKRPGEHCSQGLTPPGRINTRAASDRQNILISRRFPLDGEFELGTFHINTLSGWRAEVSSASVTFICLFMKADRSSSVR